MKSKMRELTSSEKEDVLRYFGFEPEEMEEESTIFEWSCAFDYTSDGPGYSGTLIFICGGGGPGFHDVLMYDENKELIGVKREDWD